MYEKIQFVAFKTIFGLNEFQNFLLKMKKIDEFGLNYHRYRVQPLVLHILKCSFWKYQSESSISDTFSISITALFIKLKTYAVIHNYLKMELLNIGFRTHYYSWLQEITINVYLRLPLVSRKQVIGLRAIIIVMNKKIHDLIASTAQKK